MRAGVRDGGVRAGLCPESWPRWPRWPLLLPHCKYVSFPFSVSVSLHGCGQHVPSMLLNGVWITIIITE